MTEAIREQRVVGDVRKYNMQAGPCFGPHGAILGLAYVLGAHDKVQPIVPFILPEGMPDMMADKRKQQLKAIGEVMRQLPPVMQAHRLIGFTAVTSCLLDPEFEPRHGENEKRFRYLGGFLIHNTETAPKLIASPDPTRFNASGIGLIGPFSADDHRVSPAIMMPHVKYGKSTEAVQLTSGHNPVFGIVHTEVPEILVSREESVRAVA